MIFVTDTQPIAKIVPERQAALLAGLQGECLNPRLSVYNKRA